MLALSLITLSLGFLLGLLTSVFIGIWMFFYFRYEDRRKEEKKPLDPNYQMYPEDGNS